MKIIIATTFREFNDNDNSKIQDLFIQSILKQTYKDFSFAVTIFKEKNIKNHIKTKYPEIKVDFFESNTDCRFSLSEVLHNAIKLLEKKTILIWTTCDVIFHKNFFIKIIKNTNKNTSFFGTSHPHVKYSNLSNFYNNKHISINKVEDGIDFIFFDFCFFSEKNIKLIKKYKFYDWGVFENFLTALGAEQSSLGINLYNISKVKKIENNRNQNNETQDWLSNSWNNNKITMDKFMNENKINGKYYNMTYCNKKYKMINSKIKFL